MSALARWFPGWEAVGPSRPPVFCFPAAGGNTSAFYTWRSRLSARYQVVPVELPGHRGRLHEPPHESLAALIDDLAPVMAGLLDGPHVLLGTSLGAVVAFETARRLQRLGYECERLVVVACASPRTPPPDAVHGLPEEEFLQRLHRLGATPREVLASEELRALLLPAWRADFAMLETYSYDDGEKLRSPITVVHANGDPFVSRAEAYSWKWETTGSFEFLEIEGGHFFFLDQSSTTLPRLLNEIGDERARTVLDAGKL